MISIDANQTVFKQRTVTAGDPCKLAPPSSLFSSPNKASALIAYTSYAIPIKNNHDSTCNNVIRSREQITTRTKQTPLNIDLGRKFQATIFEMCLRTMRLGERSIFICDPKYMPGYLQMELILWHHRQSMGTSTCGGCAGCVLGRSGGDPFARFLEGYALELELELLDIITTDASDT